MIISYCLNPNCSDPKNNPKQKRCESCGWNLILHNRYRVIKKIGQGGFGATFMGVDLRTKDSPLCVVKQLRPLVETPDSLKMALDLFKREAKTLGKIDHPQIPKLLSYFVDNQEFYLIQELIKGKNLRSEVKSKGTFSELAVRRFLVEMLPIIKYIHEIKIIHRDIKPANILRREKDQQLILIDFGAVKDQVNTELAKTLGNTALTKFAVGTQGFAPPEQMAMRPIYASDIYALGASCIYLLTGKSPKKMQRNNDTGKLMWETEVQVTASFSKVLQKMLEPNVRDRFRTAQEVMDILDIDSVEGHLMKSRKPQTEKPKNTNAPTRVPLPDSQISFSPTQALQKALEIRKNQKKDTNVSITWDKETFLTAYRNKKKDFSEQDLSKINIEKLKLTKFVFRYSNLEKIVLIKADLTKANLYNANLRKATLCQANLYKAHLAKSNLQGADLQGADLQGANLQGADLTEANLKGANLKGAKVELEDLKEAKTSWRTVYPNGKRKWWKIFPFL